MKDSTEPCATPHEPATQEDINAYVASLDAKPTPWANGCAALIESLWDEVQRARARSETAFTKDGPKNATEAVQRIERELGLTPSAPSSARLTEQLARVVAERDQLKRALNRQIELSTPESGTASATRENEPAFEAVGFFKPTPTGWIEVSDREVGEDDSVCFLYREVSRADRTRDQ